MPEYCFVCPKCGEKTSRILSYDDYTERMDKGSLLCYTDGTPLRRDFGAEAVISTFHPTVDNYKRKIDKKPRRNPYMNGGK